ncbi:YceI family protein [Flavobacteriaceae bacterium GSB9]|nr:YceI family protein [Flavobacteriaceae bacterium GSB9]
MNVYPKIISRVLSVIAFLVVTVNVSQAQEFNLSNDASSLKVYGTSSLHDWHINAEQQSGKIAFEAIEAGKIESLSLSVVAESLKSGKSSMDKNTYKALDTKKHKSITFQLTQVKSVTNKGEGVYAVDALGNLTIAGTKKLVPLKFTLNVANSKVKLEGEKTFKMTAFNIEPPTALFGTITTGDEVTIKFLTIFK